MPKFDEQKELKKIDDLKKKEEEELIQMLAEQKYNIPYVNLNSIPIENEAVRALAEPEARAIEAAPFKVLGHTIHVAVHAPERREILDLFKKLKDKGMDPIFYMASRSSLEKVWDRYKEISYADRVKAGSLDIAGDRLVEIGKDIHTIPDLTTAIEKISADDKTHKISHMLEIILAGAISMNASDIHIEPEEDRIRLRYRLDGVLEDVLFFNYDVYKYLISRIKLLSGMKLTVVKNQDGRFSIWVGESEISVRVSAIPGAYGESTVMRLLNPKSIQVDLEELGIEPKLFGIIEHEIKKPNGLILITGPTGSGKTTTLYAFLRRIYSEEIKIITIEDPIEYHLKGITQTQTDSKKGYTFLEGLRSALRQDPDVIMVGEIRDSETAKIAVESALTGHLVFSTLHTNNAGGVIPRLIDLDVNAKILVSALNLSMAQRLVRKLCPICKAKREPTPEEETLIKKILTTAVAGGKNIEVYGVKVDQKIELYKPVGCDKCNAGYKGRIGVFEAIYTDENLEKIIPTNPSERDIKKVGDLQGTLDMKEDGVIKILNGVTSIEELASVVELEGE
jgi:type II secretory ATPase GspE/PulE/Tfp pilus assembly ATPase PilB-like protein